MQQQPPFVRLSLRDASGSAAGINAWLRSGSSAAAGAIAAGQLAGAAGALSDARVVAYHVVFRGVETPRPTAPGNNAGAYTGVFIFSCVGTDQYAIVTIPALRSDLLLPTGAGAGAGLLIDPANPDVIAFRDLMLDSLACNPFGANLVALESAYLQWRP